MDISLYQWVCFLPTTTKKKLRWNHYTECKASLLSTCACHPFPSKSLVDFPGRLRGRGPSQAASSPITCLCKSCFVNLIVHLQMFLAWGGCTCSVRKLEVDGALWSRCQKVGMMIVCRHIRKENKHRVSFVSFNDFKQWKQSKLKGPSSWKKTGLVYIMGRRRDRSLSTNNLFLGLEKCQPCCASACQTDKLAKCAVGTFSCFSKIRKVCFPYQGHHVLLFESSADSLYLSFALSLHTEFQPWFLKEKKTKT